MLGWSGHALKSWKTKSRPHGPREGDGTINDGTSTRWDVTQLLKITATGTATIY